MEGNKVPIEEMKKALLLSWSLKSSSKWNEENPAKGQCGVTALVVNDILGGEIRKTELLEGWHFYNMINNKRYDLTASQFKEDITYHDFHSTREEAFADTNEEQYNYLTEKVFNVLFN